MIHVQAANSDAMVDKYVELRIGPGGYVAIPVAMRQELGLEPGKVLVGHVEDDRLVLESRHAVLRRIQARFRAAVPRDVSLADELVAERHRH